MAGCRFVASFSPLELPSRAVIEAAVTRIAEAGLHTRLSLAPRATQRIWRQDGQPKVHVLSEELSRCGTAALLADIRRRQGERSGVEIHASSSRLVLDVDHGLGDGRFALELAATLCAVVNGRSTRWLTDNDTPMALPRSVLHTFGRKPLHLSRAVSFAADEYRSRRRTATDVDGETWSPSFAVVVTRVDADAEEFVTRWRQSNAPQTGSAALWLFIVARALRLAGLEIADKVRFSFDCRRYLAKGQSVNANFIVGLNLPMISADSLVCWNAKMRDVIAAGVPLAAMAAVSTRALLPSARRRRIPGMQHVSAGPAEVVYSDLGRITLLDQAPWSPDDQPAIAGLLDPTGPNGVTILNTSVGGGRTISISFHDNVFDTQVISRAAEYIRDPARLLVPDSSYPADVSASVKRTRQLR
jgi:hypothetical protein